MSEFTIDDLKIRVEALKEKQKKSYDLARSLGFSGKEAMILQSKDEETIRRLAKERDEIAKQKAVCANCRYYLKTHCEIREIPDMFDGCTDWKLIDFVR